MSLTDNPLYRFAMLLFQPIGMTAMQTWAGVPVGASPADVAAALAGKKTEPTFDWRALILPVAVGGTVLGVVYMATNKNKRIIIERYENQPAPGPLTRARNDIMGIDKDDKPKKNALVAIVPLALAGGLLALATLIPPIEGGEMPDFKKQEWLQQLKQYELTPVTQEQLNAQVQQIMQQTGLDEAAALKYWRVERKETRMERAYMLGKG